MESATQTQPEIDDGARQRRNAASRKWKNANPEKVKEQSRRKYLRKITADPDYVKKMKAVAKARDPEKYREQRAAQKQRARERKRSITS